MKALLPLVASLALAGACGSSCANSKNEAEPPAPLLQRPVVEVFVSPDGGDRAEGTRQQPFASIARALRSPATKIVLLPGVHPEPQITIGRAVALEGVKTASVAGHVFVSTAEVSLKNLRLLGGLAIHLSPNAQIQSATISANLQEDALSVVRSRAHLVDLTLHCGSETCLGVTSATVSVSGLRASGEPTKRLIRVETASVSLDSLVLKGGSIAQLQASLGARVRVSRAQLQDGQGNGLVALRGASIDALQVSVKGASKIALLAQDAQVVAKNSHFASATTLAAGVAGAQVDLTQCTLVANADGALSLSRYQSRSATVTLDGGKVQHGRFPGVLIGGGHLYVRGQTHFEGDPTAPAAGVAGADAILAHGLGAHLTVDGARFSQTPGFAVSLHQDAQATLTATISGPGQGGVRIEDVAAAPVRIRGLVVDGCTGGSGIVALASTDLQITKSRVVGCAESGVLAGQRARVRVSASSVVDNGRYGFSAFGGAWLEVQGSSAKGSRWATFATCSDGADVVDGGGNTFEGALTHCP